jgi:protein SCO1/2
MRNRALLRALSLAAVLTLYCASNSLAAKLDDLNALVIEPPKTITKRALRDQHNTATEFPAADGKWKLLFFGYTACPDVCPTTMHKVAGVLRSLGPSTDRLEVYFVSIDYDRDKPELLEKFAKYFHPDIIALSGSPQELQALQNDFGVVTRKVRGKSAFAYSMTHSTYLYLLDGTGRLRAMYPGATAPDKIEKDLRYLLSNSKTNVAGRKSETDSRR